MRRDDALDHAHALVGVEPRDRRDAALCLVQEVGRGAECAGHRTVVERDEPHRADLREVRLARRLARKRPDAIRLLEPLPVGRVRHLLVGGAEDRVAQLLAARARAAAACTIVPSGRRSAMPAMPLAGRPRAAAPRARAAAARLRRAPPDRMGPSSNISSGRNVASMPPATISARGARRRARCASSRSKRSVMPVVETPMTSQRQLKQLALERALRRPACSSSDRTPPPVRRQLEHSGQSPHPERRSQKRVLTTVRIVGPDE